MKQIWIIHGGESFSTRKSYLDALRAMDVAYERLKPQRKWKSWIQEQLQTCDILLPNFPNRENAVYDEWVIYFEKLIPYFSDEVYLVGHSLGAMFLAKYFETHTLTNKIEAIVLISPGYDDDTNEELGSFKVTSAKSLPRNASTIHLLHSTDDPVVPFSEFAKYQADLPNAISHVFENRGHFNQETFPELLRLLQKNQ